MTGVLTLVLVVLALANLRLELGANLVEQLIEAYGATSSGRNTSHSSMRVHRHACDRILSP